MIRFIKKRDRSALLLQLAALMTVTLAMIVFTTRNLTGSARVSSLDVVQSFTPDLPEISGLTTVPPGQETLGTQVLAVGDKRPGFVSIDTGKSGDSGQIHRFGDGLRHRYSLCHPDSGEKCKRMDKALVSDWEAIAVDGGGQLFLLQEFSSSVYVLDRKSLAVRERFRLDFSATDNRRWQNSPIRKKIRDKSLGEGMVLMRDGHLLVARERYPAALIEFGPAGDEPLGIGPASWLRPGESFPLDRAARSPTGRQLVPLHIWQRPPGSKCDISDLAVNGAGHLHLLSENCRKITSYAALPASTSLLQKVDGWLIPSAIQSPEALAFDHLGRFILGSDIKSGKPSLFIVKARKSGKRRDMTH